MIQKHTYILKTILLLVFIPLLYLLGTNIVHSISNREIKREQSKLEARIQANQEEVQLLTGQVNTLENAVAALDAEITKLGNQIKLTHLQLAELRIQLEQTRADLEHQKQILRAALRQSYMEGDVRTIELVVQSDNFSDFFDQKEYLDRIRSTIQDSAQKVSELETQLEIQEMEQSRLLEQLKGQKVLIDSRREEKHTLLLQTKGQQNLYEKKVKADKKEYQRLQTILAARQKVLSVGTGNYPYADTKCNPPYDEEYPPPEVEEVIYPCPNDGWGYIVRQCTSWAYWRRQDLGKESGKYWGSAHEWKERALDAGYRVNQKPKKGAIGTVYVGDDAQNHVYIVEDVLDDGNIIASQYNSFSANKAWGNYSLVEKTPEHYEDDWFIHGKIE